MHSLSIHGLVFRGQVTNSTIASSKRIWASPWWRVGIAYVGLMCILGPAVWDGHQFAASRVLLPLTVAFNVQLARMGGFWPLAILGNVSVVAGLETLRVPWLWHYL